MSDARQHRLLAPARVDLIVMGGPPTSDIQGQNGEHPVNQQDKARAFRSLHTGPILVLPNAWDVASARLIEQAGAAAIATTSAGVSWSLGVPDGQHLESHTAVAALTRMIQAVQVPLTADIEGGYSRDLDGLADVVRNVVAAGAVGVNLEDAGPQGTGSLLDVREQSTRINVARQAAIDAGMDLFINARTDTYLRDGGDPGKRFADTLHRAEAYLAAGADGIFVPGVVDSATIGELARGINAPLNVMAGPAAPNVSQLADLGVARVSVGMAIAQAAYALTRRAAAELLTTGSYHQLTGALEYGELNALLSSHA